MSNEINQRGKWGNRIGYWEIQYYDSLQICHRGWYDDGDYTGWWRAYDSEDGKLIQMEYYI